MAGRYGADALGKALIIVYLILAIVSIFIPSIIARLVLNGLSLLLFIFIFFRMFSRNIPKRTAENGVYLKMKKGIREFFLLQKNKWKYRKTHIYKTCPSCKAHIRLKKISGEHACACPRCGTVFHVKRK